MLDPAVVLLGQQLEDPGRGVGDQRPRLVLVVVLAGEAVATHLRLEAVAPQPRRDGLGVVVGEEHRAEADLHAPILDRVTLRLRHRVPRSAPSTEGERVGLAGVLERLDRQARLTRVPGLSVEWGFTWDRSDALNRTWWPQGLTCSGEAGAAYDGPRVLLAAWYAKDADGTHLRSRVSVVELESLRYRHVELVTAKLEPLPVHAGGLAWSGDHLLVAATKRGLGVAPLSGIRRLTDARGRERDVLPVTSWLRAEQDEEQPQLRYSFCSLDSAEPDRPRLVVGEYGGSGATHRIVDYPLDPATGLPLAGDDGCCAARPVSRGPVRMQGLVVVDGVQHVTCSHGTRLPGTLHVGRPGKLRIRLAALPPGPEDLTYWPELGLLWCQSEHPGRRYVFAVRPSRRP